MVQISLTLFRLLCQDVAVVSVFPLDLAGARQREALSGGGVGFYLRHGLKI